MWNTQHPRSGNVRKSLLTGLALAGMVLGCLTSGDSVEDGSRRSHRESITSSQLSAQTDAAATLTPVVKSIATRVNAAPKVSVNPRDLDDERDRGVLRVEFDDRSYLIQ